MRRFPASLALWAAFAAGCRSHSADRSAFQKALDNYYNGQKTCLFQQTVKFPAQADPNHQDQTRDIDALTDAGMLMRTPELTLMRTSGEKKRFLAGSKQVNDYDLSSKGRWMWTADPAQPGYGNFCFGSVISVDNYSALDSSGDAYTVSYHYEADLPDWARTDEMKTAFPSVDRVSAPRAATANLARSRNGWEVQHVTTSR